MAISFGILAGIIAMIGYGLSNAIAKSPIRNIGSKKTVFYRNLFVTLMLLPLLFIFPAESYKLSYLLIAVLISIIGYLPLVIFYKAMKYGKVGVVSPIAGSAVIITVLLSIIFFNEVLTITQSFAMLLTICGIILISLDFKNFKSSHLFDLSSGAPYALVACLLWGLVFFLFKIPVMLIGPVLTSFIIEAGITFTSAGHIAFSKKSFTLPNKKDLKHIFLIAFFGAIGTLFYTLGLKASYVSIVAVLTSANPLVATLYGKVIYKEKLKASQYIAILFILAGIILISWL